MNHNRQIFLEEEREPEKRSSKQNEGTNTYAIFDITQTGRNGNSVFLIPKWPAAFSHYIQRRCRV